MIIEFEGQRYTVFKQSMMIPGEGNAMIHVDLHLHLYPLDSHLILCRRQGEDIVILRIFHSRQHWQRFL